MSDIKLAFGTASQGITVSINSLADNAARECLALDNTTNLFLDAILYLAIKTGSGTIANEKRVVVWFYASEDGTNYCDPATGLDASITLAHPVNLYGPYVIQTPNAGVTYKAVVTSVAEFFGGVLPPKWGIVIENKSGLALESTGHTKEYRGVFQTVL